MDTNKLIVLMAFLAYTIILCFLCILACKLKPKKIYIDTAWHGWKLSSYKFKEDDNKFITFVIFSGLKDHPISSIDALDLEAEMEDTGILPLFPKKNEERPIIYLIDRNTGYKYKYLGKYSEVKFQRLD